MIRPNIHFERYMLAQNLARDGRVSQSEADLLRDVWIDSLPSEDKIYNLVERCEDINSEIARLRGVKQ